MGAVKVLVGVAFLGIGILLLVIAFVPIPLFINVSVFSRVMAFQSLNFDAMTAAWDFSPMFLASGYLSISYIIPYIGCHFVLAGVKSMRYEQEKKEYYYSETRIGLLIAGFILLCTAITLILIIILEIMAPAFQFLMYLVPAIYVSGLIPRLLIPIVLTVLIIFFIYWLGSKIMQSGIKKEELYK